MNTEWTANDVKSTITNPVYTGIGPFPAIIDLEKWLDATARMVEEVEVKVVIDGVLEHFEEANPNLAPSPKPYINQAQCDSRAALRRLLADLRELAQEESK